MNRHTPAEHAQSTPLAETFDCYLQDKGNLVHQTEGKYVVNTALKQSD